MDELTQTLKAIDDYCEANEIGYNLVINDTKIKSVTIAQDIDQIKDKLLTILPEFRHINIELKKIRGGTVLVISDKAITELEKAEHMKKINEYSDILTVAKDIVESQRHSATSGRFRSIQSSRQRRSFTSNTSFGNIEHPNSPKAHRESKLNRKIDEALEGIANQQDMQPQDIFDKFGSAMQELGSALGIGPIQDLLKKRGISWKLSSDKQAIIFFVQNATTDAPQPIARINYETLFKPNEFEQQLLTTLDLAKGDAPGAFSHKQEIMRNQEKAVREISRKLVQPPTSPSPEEAVAPSA